MEENNTIQAQMICVGIAVTFLIFLAYVCVSCTISFQNISTHGTATDLVDENQTEEPTIDANLTIPVKAL